MKNFSRRNFLIGSTGVILTAGGVAWYLANKAAPIGFEVDDETLNIGKEFLKKVISVDVHAHPGRSFVDDARNLSTKLKVYSALGSFEEDTVADMIEGGLSMSSFSTVADFQLLGFAGGGLKATREFNKGEAWDSYQIQIKTLKQLLKDDLVMPVLSPDDVLKAKKLKKIGAFFTSEGADFLEGSLENLNECYEDGMRSLTLMHYHINEIGDIQTEPARYNTLTPFGIALVKAMNQKGMLIDLAHAAKGTSMKAMEVTEKPVMISHSAVRREGFDSKRFIDLEEAKMAAQTGGIIGAWPSGIGLTTFSDYVEQIFHLVDEVGINHVALGTDMDANYKPVFDNYKLTPLLAGTLLKRGMNEEETAKILGGNFMRVFREVMS